MPTGSGPDKVFPGAVPAPPGTAQRGNLRLHPGGAGGHRAQGGPDRGNHGRLGKCLAGITAGYAVSVACLNDKEWEAAEPEMATEERAMMQCFMESLGGPARMAEDLKNGNTASLEKVFRECVPDEDLAPDATTPAETPTT